MDPLSNAWKPWLLLLSKLAYFLPNLPFDEVCPGALLCWPKLVPIRAVFLYPVGELFSMGLLVSELFDSLAKSLRSWFFLLGEFSRSLRFFTVLRGLPTLHEASQHWFRLFSTADWELYKMFDQFFVAKDLEEHRVEFALATQVMLLVCR